MYHYFMQLGDHVLVEAAYNQNMPFKWNATRVQVLPSNSNNQAPSNSGAGGNKNYSQRDTANDSSFRGRRYSPERNDRQRNDRRPRSRDNRDADVISMKLSF
jgi:hypothetical protein